MTIDRLAAGTLLAAFAVAGCARAETESRTVDSSAGKLTVEERAENLNHPWGLAFLPDGRLLVTERAGRLRILGTDGKLSEPLAGVPAVQARGQGGLLDVALDPDFAPGSTTVSGAMSKASPARTNRCCA